MNQNSAGFVVTIDGPAGSGKSTVAAKLAKKLGFVHLNSGALFRAVALEALARGISLQDDQAVSKLARSLRFSFEVNLDHGGEHGGETNFLVNGLEVGSRIQSTAASEAASKVGLLKNLREVLVDVQRQVAVQHGSVVVEGRDAGTVVFPEARHKFYLDASLDIRAKRRGLDLARLGGQTTSSEDELFARVKSELDARDKRDQTREHSPHRMADNAVLVDTSGLTIDEVVEAICQHLK